MHPEVCSSTASLSKTKRVMGNGLIQRNRMLRYIYIHVCTMQDLVEMVARLSLTTNSWSLFAISGSDFNINKQEQTGTASSKNLHPKINTFVAFSAI